MFNRQDYYSKYKNRSNLYDKIIELEKIVPYIHKVTGIYGEYYKIDGEPSVHVSEFSEIEQNAIFEWFVISELLNNEKYKENVKKQTYLKLVR